MDLRNLYVTKELRKLRNKGISNNKQDTIDYEFPIQSDILFRNNDIKELISEYYTQISNTMPKLKCFCKLSRRQRNRRLKQIQNRENFIQENIIQLSSYQENQVIEENPVFDKEDSNNASGIVTDHNLLLTHKGFCNNICKATVANQPNVTNVSIISEEEYYTSLPIKDVSLKEKLILWTDENRINQSSLTSLLQILQSEGHNDLPGDGRTLMNSPRHTTIYERSKGYYYHYGLQNGIIDFLSRLNNSKFNNPIIINLNIDGLPISKSTNSQLWPVLAQVVLDVPTVPFIVGAFHGYKKPSTDNHFLQHFITEFKQLSKTGFIFNNNTYQIKIRAIICDSPARSFITCTKSHNGYFGCSKCIIEGDYINHKMLFLQQNCPLRTDQSFILRQNPEHHIGTSLFEQIPLPMVSTFPLDYMHLICLGQMKKLLSLWTTGPCNEARFSAAHIRNLTSDLISLKKYVCCEFVRMPIDINEVARWKATEFRLFLLYLGPILLHKYLPSNYMKHFTALHCAIRILCHPQDYLNNNQYAKELLFYFVQYYEKLYGKENMIYTVHNLIHLSDDAKQFGSLDTFSAFPFENHLYILKKLLRKHEKPLQQIHKRIIEKNTAHKLRKYIPAVKYPILVSQNNKNLPFECYQSYDAIKFKNFKLSCSTQANRFCFLKTNRVVMIHYIGLKNGEPIIIGQEYKNYFPFDLYPCDSRYMNVFVVDNNLSELKYFLVNEISRKAILLPWEGEKFCIFPLLHSDVLQGIMKY